MNMVTVSLEQQIVEAVHTLSREQQREVLEYIRALKMPEGMTGREFIAHVRALNFPPEDLAEIAEAIRELDVIDPEEDVRLDG
jgi:hypothetical protein